MIEKMLITIRVAALLTAVCSIGCGVSSTGPEGGSKHQAETGVSSTDYPCGQPKDAGSPALASSTVPQHPRDKKRVDAATSCDISRAQTNAAGSRIYLSGIPSQQSQSPSYPVTTSTWPTVSQVQPFLHHIAHGVDAARERSLAGGYRQRPGFRRHDTEGTIILRHGFSRC